jgi:hypothetical protein
MSICCIILSREKNQPVQAKNGKEKYVQIRRKLQFRASGYSKIPKRHLLFSNIVLGCSIYAPVIKRRA